jgi:hypothetical protein
MMNATITAITLNTIATKPRQFMDFEYTSQDVGGSLIGHGPRVRTNKTLGLYRDCPERGCEWGVAVVGQLR